MDRILCFIIKVFIFLAKLARPLSRIGIGSFEEWTPGKELKLLIVGYNGARNTGADARVVSAVAQIRRLFGPDRVRISVLTLNEENLQGYFDDDVRLIKISTIFPADLYRACSSHHVAVLCEGSTLKSTFANALSLFFCEASGVMAAQGKPCIAYGSEVGRMDDFLRSFAGRTCGGTYFITRTQPSLQILEDLDLKGHVGTDTAWLYDGAIPSKEADRLLRAQGWDGIRPLLGIAVINPFCWPVRASLLKWVRAGLTGNPEGRYDKWYFYSDSDERRAAYDRYISEIADAAGRFCDAHGFFPVLLGMERMDKDPCHRLMQRLDRPCALFFSEECAADIMTGILRKLSTLITSRYHAAVLGMTGSSPVVSVSMDERLDSLMEELSFDRRYLYHVTDQDLGRKVMDSLIDIEEHREELMQYIRQRVFAYRSEQEAMGTFLKEYIEKHLKDYPEELQDSSEELQDSPEEPREQDRN